MNVLRGIRPSIALLTIVSLISIIAIGPAILISHFISNAGLLALSRSMVQYGILERTPHSDHGLIDAERWLKTATKLDTTNQRAWYGLVVALSNQGKWDEAVVAIQSIQTSATDFTKYGDIAQTSHRYEEALVWYGKAAELLGDYLNIFPNSINGPLVVLESFATTNAWQPCPWCENVTGSFRSHNGVLELSYYNIPGKAAGTNLVSAINAPILFSHELLIRLKSESGPLLTIETVVDGVRSRPLSYQPVPRDWTVWSMPIQGDTLNEILIGISSSNSAPKTAGELSISVDWIGLR